MIALRIGCFVMLTTFCCSAAALAQEEKQKPAAQIVITAKLGCLHCDYGVGDSCAACLKLDEKTPIELAGKSRTQFEACRFENKVLVAEGVLTRQKNGQLILTSDKAAFHTADDKLAPALGKARIQGNPVCGSCDLKVCDQCTLAVANSAAPIILDGKLANQHAEGAKGISAVGRLYIDARGLIRLDASSVDLKK